MTNNGTTTRRIPRALAEKFIAVMRLVRSASSRAEVAGLSNARYELLHVLIHDGPTRMGTVAERLGVSPRTVTPMVDALERARLLRRVPDPTDRRAQLLKLTPAGVALMRRAHEARVALVARVFDGLDRSDRATLAGLLDKIRANSALG